MFWQEDEDKTLPYQAPDDILDLSFSIQCKRLPLDHAWALSQAIRSALPWFHEESATGIHTIHVAESGNGWLRPDDAEHQMLLPSRRTRMALRIPKQRLADTQKLTGKTLDIDGYPLTVGDAKEKPLLNAAVIFARYVLSDAEEQEPDFLQRMAKEIHTTTDVKVKKMMCGKSNAINTPDGVLFTRHLMVADLDSAPSIRLQQYGLGGGRKLGCGLFLPHKSIKTLKPTE
ncbi:type I-MYXAN CRISPR-associated protein Cas6/Cmx6 [Candidatus Thiothrix sp. Deng01]|uniref:Type I-MYXAN CRISPR-associated protein Cas6/Cmx6 n=1 Tax=Candidatus Thiothrix phosphatis TaxID=3112415 RepID=A0ABU6D2P0_9GAMM|nr:type I-MYXAN CRISPR-associated protein Cas6/Cmx6 [Candidatus Thiothrix sp. Deng01]MEB4593351.1 type I-MYXAN CRISPR-associated protein Cas6/Cmx6 [Candidatus Thiothrix sp. Deng01]